MNKKLLIIFLVVIIGFVSYFWVTKSKEQKLCEEYGGEWFSKEIWEIGDVCEFVYLSLSDIPYYYIIYENLFDENKPNEEFYLLHEEHQKRIIEVKELVSFLGEEYKDFYYYTIYVEYFDGDEPNEEFYLLHEEDQIDIIESKNLISSLEEIYEKEINVAKEYCMEVGGRFGQGIDDYKRMVRVLSPDEVLYHWVVRCYIK